MRILHVVRGLANSSGTTHIVGPLAEAQARQGHTVEVFYVEKPGRPAVIPDSSLVASRGFAMTVPTEHLGWSRSFARAVRCELRKADVVHIHAVWNFPTWCAMREAARSGVPYIVAPQGSLEEWALRRGRRLKALYARMVEKPYFDRAAAMQALTEAEATQCRQFGIKAPVMILPNGVDLSAVDGDGGRADLKAELSWPSESIVFLFLGRLFPKKGLDLLIPAFAELAARRNDVFLAIAGDDAGTGYRHHVDQLTRTYSLGSRVRLLGEVSGRRKFEVLRGADVFVLSSYSEGLPVAALEAMACRCPVVITHNCNLEDVGDREAGWVVEPTRQSVLHGLSRAAASGGERRRRAESARQLVEDRFTWDEIARTSISAYRSYRPTLH